jgi:transcriptional regulator with XRE-family HTH domain
MQNIQAKELGRRLRQRREQLGLSTRDVAERTGTTHGTIVRLEQGAIEKPAADKLSRIAEALGMNLADVYAFVDYGAPEELPSFRPYLRTKYRDLPASAVRDLERSFRQVARRHGIDPEGPRAGEDEQPEEQH